jgi:hypothetical protein
MAYIHKKHVALKDARPSSEGHLPTICRKTVAYSTRATLITEVTCKNCARIMLDAMRRG